MTADDLTPIESDELQELLDGLLNQSLDASQHERLEQWLKTSAAAREQYLACIDLHYDLLRIHSQVGDLPSNSGRMLESLLSQDQASPQRSVFGLIQRTLGSLGGRRLCLAAALLLAVGGIGALSSLSPRSQDVESTQSSPTLAVADGKPNEPSGVLLTQAASAKLYGDRLPALQSEMSFGREYALTAGIIEIKFPAGATAIIEAPAVFVVATESRLLMKTGVCSVHAPEGAEGFRVDTPLADVVDLGTRFVVDVSQSGETSVQVIEGEAEVYPNQSVLPSVAPEQAAVPINLQSGQANRVVSQGRVVAETAEFQIASYKPSLPDRIISFDAVEDGTGAVDELRSVTVQRGGAPFTYRVEQLTGVELIHFHTDNNALMVTSAAIDDPKLPDVIHLPRARYLESDHSLCSGLINPGGQLKPLKSDPIIFDPQVPDQLGTPGLGFRFKQPLTNSVGPDLVLFELQMIVNPEQGDGFHVSPLRFTPELHSITIDAYDIDLASPESRYLSPFLLYRTTSIPRTFQELLSLEHFGGSELPVRAKALAVAIDLSDLGYPLGAEVEGLFLQDNLADGDKFDPVFIGGFPPLP
jgi:ferric-dicitrate binding protein FerR (iron transport regulator)